MSPRRPNEDLPHEESAAFGSVKYFVHVLQVQQTMFEAFLKDLDDPVGRKFLQILPCRVKSFLFLLDGSVKRSFSSLMAPFTIILDRNDLHDTPFPGWRFCLS